MDMNLPKNWGGYPKIAVSMGKMMIKLLVLGVALFSDKLYIYI